MNDRLDDIFGDDLVASEPKTLPQDAATGRFTLPWVFWEDHFERCAEHPGQRTVIKVTQRHVTVDLDAVALVDLQQDAMHYAHDGLDAAPAGLRSSARFTLLAIAKILMHARRQAA